MDKATAVLFSFAATLRAVNQVRIGFYEQVLAPKPRVHHLTGLWLDGSRRVTVTQSGDTVDATYIQPYVCDFRGGTGRTAQTTFDFRGILDFNTITGHWQLSCTCRMEYG